MEFHKCKSNTLFQNLLSIFTEVLFSYQQFIRSLIPSDLLQDFEAYLDPENKAAILVEGSEEGRKSYVRTQLDMYSKE